METAQRFNTGKVAWSYIDWEAMQPLVTACQGWANVNLNPLEELVKVMEFGAKKYARDNWKKGMPVSQCMNSLLRHTFRLIGGEQTDQESGLSHYGHILANAMFASRFVKHNPDFDDRQDILDPQIEILQTVPTSVEECLALIIQNANAFLEGQDEDQIDNTPLIGYVMYYACFGYSLQNAA